MGVNYQPQLVQAGFLNHQQYVFIDCHSNWVQETFREKSHVNRTFFFGGRRCDCKHAWYFFKHDKLLQLFFFVCLFGRSIRLIWMLICSSSSRFLGMQDACFVKYTQVEEYGEDEDEEGDMEIGEAGSLEWAICWLPRDCLVQLLVKLPCCRHLLSNMNLLIECSGKMMGQIYLPSAKVEWRKTAQRTIAKDQEWRAELEDKFVCWGYMSDVSAIGVFQHMELADQQQGDWQTGRKWWEWMNYSPFSIAVLETTVPMIFNRRRKGISGISIMLIQSCSDCFWRYFPTSRFYSFEASVRKSKTLESRRAARWLGKFTWTMDVSQQTWLSSAVCLRE